MTLNKEAPLLPHPYGNTKKTPYLTCSVSGKGTYGIGTIEVTVKAIPDTGCSGFSSKHLKGQLGPTVSDVTFFHRKVSWGLPSVT